MPNLAGAPAGLNTMSSDRSAVSPPTFANSYSSPSHVPGVANSPAFGTSVLARSSSLVGMRAHHVTRSCVLFERRDVISTSHVMFYRLASC